MSPRKSTAKTSSKAKAQDPAPAAKSGHLAPPTIEELAATDDAEEEDGEIEADIEALASDLEGVEFLTQFQSELEDLSTEELWVHYRNEVERLAEEAIASGEFDPETNRGRVKLTSPVLEELRNQLIERHYPLVRYIAERLLQTLPKSIELDDLISAGQFGLMDAIRGFDPDRGIKFKTYCSTRIRGSILDQLRSQDWVPRLVRLKASKIDKALQRLTGEYGREPTHAELAKSLEMEHTDLSKEIQESQAKTMFSLSEKWDDDDDGSTEKVEILEDHNAIDPVHELNRRDLMLFITRSLTHKERFIIEQYYQYGHTMREIGEMLTLTESRVCQIHSNVMGRLKGLLAQRDGSLET
jgi:RNA polymerase sigma factor FliA